MVVKINLGVVISLFIGVIVLVSCKSKTTTTTSENLNVLVQLYDDESVKTLEGDYKTYSLKQEKVVSRPMKIYLFSFDPSTTTDIELVELLKESQLVKEAQRNQKVEIRNQ